MRKLLERNIASLERRLVLLAPPNAVVPGHFRNVTFDPVRHRQLVRDVQRLRGSVYQHEGHLTDHQLSPDGLHITPEDDRSWHLLMTDQAGVSSCIWYLEHENTASIEDLRIRNCPLGDTAEWRDKLKLAVRSEINRARAANLHYAELGGWAVTSERRGTCEGLMMALGAYGLSRILGGALGITTANVRCSSSSILRRLGGSYLEVSGKSIPAYFDAHYNAEIELLRFDSRNPNAKYLRLIELLADKLSNVAVFARGGTHAIPVSYAAMPVTPRLVPQPVFAA